MNMWKCAVTCWPAHSARVFACSFEYLTRAFAPSSLFNPCARTCAFHFRTPSRTARLLPVRLVGKILKNLLFTSLWIHLKNGSQTLRTWLCYYFTLMPLLLFLPCLAGFGLFCRQEDHKAKKKICWNVEGPVFYMCNSGFRSVWFNMGLAAALRTESTRCFFLLSWPFSLAGKHRSSPNSAPCHKLVIVAVWPTTMQVERQFFPNVALWCKQCVPEINQKNCRTPRICPPTAL
jgi:hypothetical protein